MLIADKIPNLITYGIFTAIGLVVAILLLKIIKYPAKQNGIKVSSLIPVFILGAIIGSKIPVILSYGWHPEFIWTGKSYYGAILGAFFAINLYKIIFKIKGNFGDRFVIPLCVSAGIGKIGCFFNGCCSGTATNFLFKCRNFAGVYVHPVQFYETLFEFSCAGLFFYFYRTKRLQGSHFLIYILLYMIFRFGIEFIRIEPKVAFGISVYQIMSVIFIPLFAFILYRRQKNAAAIH